MHFVNAPRNAHINFKEAFSASIVGSQGRRKCAALPARIGCSSVGSYHLEMDFPKFEGAVTSLVRTAADTPWFLLACAGMAVLGTLTALFPVTVVVVPAVLLVPSRWKPVALVCALGSAVGATALTLGFHHLAWAQVYQQFPEFASHPSWVRAMQWVERYGAWALFAIAASPLPQTPALLVFAITRQDYVDVFVAIFAGKLLKYSVMAWLASRFPHLLAYGPLHFVRQVWHLCWASKTKVP